MVNDMIYPIFPMTKPFNEVERRFSLEAGHPRIAPLTSSYSASRFWHSENPMKISKSMGVPWKEFCLHTTVQPGFNPYRHIRKFHYFSPYIPFHVLSLHMFHIMNIQLTLRIYMLKLLSAYITFKKINQ